MTIFEIEHTTAYAYSRPIFLEPHTLRLRPRCDADRQLLDFQFDIQPNPAGATQSLDLDGNIVLDAWFEGLTERLLIRTRSRVAARRSNPFDYILTDPSAELLPMAYAEPARNQLAPYSVRCGESGIVEGFAHFVSGETERRTLRFLTALNREIYESCRQVVREWEPPHAPEDTLVRREGSCRDLAVLFIDACRCVGVAARFVSGYQVDSPRDEPRYLHAWAEVYLPGAGWRGYDPSRGLAVADRHVALATAAAPQLAAPVTGAFRGDGAESNLSATIDIRIVDEGSGGTAGS
jgi:transglutaminase-like putative cysteine protease